MRKDSLVCVYELVSRLPGALCCASSSITCRMCHAAAAPIVCGMQASASLAVERELRARAELKEEEERRERIAANAQLLAMQQAHAAEMEGLRVRCPWVGRIFHTTQLSHISRCIGLFLSMRPESRVGGGGPVDSQGQGGRG
jgi:hypothetical protein